ncbi:unnamed protein product [Eruca vesicaria subsp. sativa]|uniref:Uncharacterized protein n=1 Tax=Eruca vesicaria subsp. sativa TaxID=29727 RepID=A0ABC8LNW1_ERUVS|nr:unnamed protein product [Eruca vesicaria subsp. sativa]
MVLWSPSTLVNYKVHAQKHEWSKHDISISLPPLWKSIVADAIKSIVADASFFFVGVTDTDEICVVAVPCMRALTVSMFTTTVSRAIRSEELKSKEWMRLTIVEFTFL